MAIYELRKVKGHVNLGSYPLEGIQPLQRAASSPAFPDCGNAGAATNQQLTAAI